MKRKPLQYLLLYILLVLNGSLTHAAPAVETNYQLGTGDHIRIQVYGESDLTLETYITDSGIISYPFLGEIPASRRTLAQLQQFIHDGLVGDYLVDPKVTVSILNYRQFYINGEVKKPGGFTYMPGLTVRKAISLAGGLTERASDNKIFIISEATPNQQKKALLNSQVKPGDIITIEQSFF